MNSPIPLNITTFSSCSLHRPFMSSFDTVYSIEEKLMVRLPLYINVASLLTGENILISLDSCFLLLLYWFCLA